MFLVSLLFEHLSTLTGSSACNGFFFFPCSGLACDYLRKASGVLLRVMLQQFCILNTLTSFLVMFSDPFALSVPYSTIGEAVNGYFQNHYS